MSGSNGSRTKRSWPHLNDAKTLILPPNPFDSFASLKRRTIIPALLSMFPIPSTSKTWTLKPPNLPIPPDSLLALSLVVAWAQNPKVYHRPSTLPSSTFDPLDDDGVKKKKITRTFNRLPAQLGLEPPPFHGVSFLVAEFLRREAGPLSETLAKEWSDPCQMGPRIVQRLFEALGDEGLVGGGGEVRGLMEPLLVVGGTTETLDSTSEKKKRKTTKERTLLRVELGNLIKEAEEREEAATRTTSDDEDVGQDGQAPSTTSFPFSFSHHYNAPSSTNILSLIAAHSLAWALQIVPLLPSPIPLDPTRRHAFLSLPAFHSHSPPIPQLPYLLAVFGVYSGALTPEEAKQVGRDAIPRKLDSATVVAVFKAWKKAGLVNSPGPNTTRPELSLPFVPPGLPSSYSSSSLNRSTANLFDATSFGYPGSSSPRSSSLTSTLAPTPSSLAGRDANGTSVEEAWSVEDDEEQTRSTGLHLRLSSSTGPSSLSVKRKREKPPSGWVLVSSKTWEGASYYFSKETRETRWTSPDV